MANVDSPFGLKPVMHRNGNPWNGAVTAYYVPSTYATALYIGDPVIKMAAGSNTAAVSAPGVGEYAIGTLAEVNLAPVTDDTKITGVITGFAPLANDLTKLHNPASTERIIFVCDDPDVIYEVQADGPVTAATMGLNAQMIATHAGSTTTGKSGRELDTTSDVPAADASNQLLILRAVNRADNDTTLTHAKVLVMINQHTQTQGTVGALGI